MPVVDTGWRRGSEAELVDILLPDGEEYKIVFINSDGSSKEEDLDNVDTSSTSSSLLLEECDWDYFEPSHCFNNWSSPFGSPNFLRKSPVSSGISQAILNLRESDTCTDEDSAKASNDSINNAEEKREVECMHLSNIQNISSQRSCKNCGALTQYIPVPIPVPIPYPVPTLWTPEETVVLYDLSNTDQDFLSRVRCPSSVFWPYMNKLNARSILFMEDFNISNEWRLKSDINMLFTDKEDFSNISKFEASSIRIKNSIQQRSKKQKSITKYKCDGGPNKRKIQRKKYVISGNEYDSDESSSNTENTVNPFQGSSSSISSDSDRSIDEGKYTLTLPDLTISDKLDLDSDKSDYNPDDEVLSSVILKKVNYFKDSNCDEDTNFDKCKVDPSYPLLKNNDNCTSDYTTSSPGLSDVSSECIISSDSDLHRSSKEEQKVNISVGYLSGEEETSKEPLLENTITSNKWNESIVIRSSEPVIKERELNHDGERTGALVLAESGVGLTRHAARYTSLVMITQETAPSYQQVSVVTSNTTTLVPDENIVVQHTNWNDGNCVNSKFRETPEHKHGEVMVITGSNTLSAFEEGLADDDSWVENLSTNDEDLETNSNTDDSSSGEEVTLSCSAANDDEEDKRGYFRSAIDFTLHTILEESCEESEPEHTTKKKIRPTSATDLEKYFFFGLGDGYSETSSVYSEGIESINGSEEMAPDPVDLASSRLEKYFLSGFMGFTMVGRRDSDGSVGSDSEGKPSPEQRRKRLVRARGTGRNHSSSLDNFLANPELGILDQTIDPQTHSEVSDSDTNESSLTSFEKLEGQFDTVKRKKLKKNKNTHSSTEELKLSEGIQDSTENNNSLDVIEDEPQMLFESNLDTNNHQSRDSGFIGSCDDLLKESYENKISQTQHTKNDTSPNVDNCPEDKKNLKYSSPPVTSLTRKDSFNNWSSDEETNLMMCKMRQFFKTLVANSQYNSQCPTTPVLGTRMSPKPVISSKVKNRWKSPQLIYFENELTRLMKTVPGIRDDQVREIVEYLSSEDTWSDSYDSSDYTSSDLEGTCHKSDLQRQISDSCKEIINKFDNAAGDEEGDEGDGGIIDENNQGNKETTLVYKKLVASLEKIASGENVSSHNSPPLIAKVMHHIGSRLVALMHEVSGGESHISPKTTHSHRRLNKKNSCSSTTTDEDSTSECTTHDNILDSNLTSYNLLSRSKSHDMLLSESKHLKQTVSGVFDAGEERETSDCERFSWRGSFESALLASDSRNKLSLIGSEASTSGLALAAIAAKRRSAGDLLFNDKSREQLDRVRSCGSIGESNVEDKLWITKAKSSTKRRSSVPEASYGSGESADEEYEEDDIQSPNTLPRSLETVMPISNSLPRLPTSGNNNIHKTQSMCYFTPQNVKSARYRPPGYKFLSTVPKRASSAPGLQLSKRNLRSQILNVPNDDCLSTDHTSPILGSRISKSSSPKICRPGKNGSETNSSQEWQNTDDETVRIHSAKNTLSGLGIRSDSMASVYSGAGEGRYGSVVVRGQVEFGLQYNYKASALEIHIKQCKDLSPVDVKRNRSDPYVKIYLLPDKSKTGKRKTKVKKCSLNPVFDEILKFNISLNGLETRTLWLTVWHSDIFGRNDFLGEVRITLENKVFDDTSPKWYNLQERSEPFEAILSYKGDIIVCLKFVPPDISLHKKGKRSRGSLHVLIKEAKSLTAIKTNGTSDPFCKGYLLPEKGRNSKQKTSVIRRTLNPIWNCIFIYEDVTLQELAERCLELTVWDHDRLSSNEFLGGVRFSLGTGKHYGKEVDWMDATGKELSLWKSMLERPNFWVEGCLPLRPSLYNQT